MAHGQWTEIEARGVLEAWSRIGLSVEVLATDRGLVAQRLFWWKRKLGLTRSSLPPAVVPVHVADPPPLVALEASFELLARLRATSLAYESCADGGEDDARDDPRRRCRTDLAGFEET